MEIRKIDDDSLFFRGKKEGVFVGNIKQSEKSKLTFKVVLSTESNDEVNFTEDKILISAPGEYEVGGVEYLGVSGGEGQTVYVVNIDGVLIGVLGALKEPLKDKRIEKINELDVLLVSLDKDAKVPTKSVMEWAKKWGANYVIPYHDADKSKLDKFLDEVDEEGAEPIESLKIERDNLPEGMEIVVLKGQG